jgi:hypothetical protein
MPRCAGLFERCYPSVPKTTVFPTATGAFAISRQVGAKAWRWRGRPPSSFLSSRCGDWKTAFFRKSLCSFRATIFGGIEYRREEIVAGTGGDSQEPRKPSVSY